MLRRLTIILLLAVAAGALFQQPVNAQCAMCRTALENSPEGQAMASSFANGILLLLAAPYVIFGTIGFVIFRAYRKKSRESVNPYIPRD